MRISTNLSRRRCGAARYQSCQLCLDGINHGTSVPAVATINGIRVCATHQRLVDEIRTDAERDGTFGIPRIPRRVAAQPTFAPRAVG